MTDPRRPPGRPPLDAHSPSVSVNIRMPSTLYDALYVQARVDRVNVPEYIRRVLRDARREPPHDE